MSSEDTPQFECFQVAVLPSAVDEEGSDLHASSARSMRLDCYTLLTQSVLSHYSSFDRYGSIDLIGDP